MTAATQSARDQILGSVRKSLGRGPLEGDAATALSKRLEFPPVNLIPARSKVEEAELIALFKQKVEDAACSMSEVGTLGEVPEALAKWLSNENLPARVIQAEALADSLDWATAPTVDVKTGVTDGSDETSLTPVFAGIAETGTLLLLSNSASPTGLNFLPENHVVVVRQSQIVGALEDAWARLRAFRSDKGCNTVPRSVNLITGPSRTGDIEQKIQMGAHGPRRLHVILVRG